MVEPRGVPGSSVARHAPAERADAEGTDVRAHGRAARGGHDVAPRVARRGTELGLPLQLGAGRRVRAMGPLHAWVRLRGQQLLLLHRRSDRRRDSPLKVLYAVDDGIDLKESTLDHLTGYEDSRPVRIGNDAHDQEQHDIWGALLHSVHLHTRSGEFLSGVTWENLERQVECAIERWGEPDRGIWENRGEPRHFTSSKIMCWVALDRGSAPGGDDGQARPRRSLARRRR